MLNHTSNFYALPHLDFGILSKLYAFNHCRDNCRSKARYLPQPIILLFIPSGRASSQGPSHMQSSSTVTAGPVLSLPYGVDVKRCKFQTEQLGVTVNDATSPYRHTARPCSARRSRRLLTVAF